MTPLAPLVKQTFKGFQIVLPLGVSARPEQSFPGDEDDVETDPRWLFVPASDLAIHKKVVRMVSALLNAFIDDMSSAICKSWNAWKAATTFANVLVNGGVGVLPPGGMLGGSTMTQAVILSNMRLDDRNAIYRGYAEAIGGALEKAWAAWATGYTNMAVPFPAAATLPGPLPPTPNVPIPLATGTSAGDALMTPPALTAAMLAIHGPGGLHALPLFRAFSQAIATIFGEWKAGNQPTNILATGGVGMPVVGALGMGGNIVGPDVMAQPEGMQSKLDKLREFLANLPTPKELIASAVSEALHNIKEELLSHLPSLPPRPDLPSLPSFPGLPQKPSLPSGSLPKPGQGEHGGHAPQGGTIPRPGDGSLPRPGQGGHTAPSSGGGGAPQPGGGDIPRPGEGNHGGQVPGQGGSHIPGGTSAPAPGAGFPSHAGGGGAGNTGSPSSQGGASPPGPGNPSHASGQGSGFPSGTNTGVVPPGSTSSSYGASIHLGMGTPGGAGAGSTNLPTSGSPGTNTGVVPPGVPGSGYSSQGGASVPSPASPGTNTGVVPPGVPGSGYSSQGGTGQMPNAGQTPNAGPATATGSQPGSNFPQSTGGSTSSATGNGTTSGSSVPVSSFTHAPQGGTPVASSHASAQAGFDPLNLAQGAARQATAPGNQALAEDVLLGGPAAGNFQWAEAPLTQGQPLGGVGQPLAAHEFETSKMVSELGWQAPKSLPGVMSPPELPAPLKATEAPPVESLWAGTPLPSSPGLPTSNTPNPLKSVLDSLQHPPSNPFQR